MCAAVPSPELVDRVRDLYQKRVSDVRFLIPVLNGLTKVSVALLITACECRLLSFDILLWPVRNYGTRCQDCCMRLSTAPPALDIR